MQSGQGMLKVSLHESECREWNRKEKSMHNGVVVVPMKRHPEDFGNLSPLLYIK
jgi:hypothetical protein